MKLAEIAQDRLTIERREVALVRKARAEGHVVDLRVDTDVLALLGIELVVTSVTPTAPFGEAARAVQHALRVFQPEPPADAT
jgi:hypothetical protein